MFVNMEVVLSKGLCFHYRPQHTM